MNEGFYFRWVASNIFFYHHKDKMNYDKINPKGESLTVDILRTFPGYENYNDEQALEVIDTLVKLSMILYEEACKINAIYIDNQQVVYLNSDKNPEKQKLAA